MNQPPTARLRPRSRLSWLWLLPLLALLGAGWLVWSSLAQRGIPVEISFAQGHGLKAGDSLRYRGIQVGRVREVVLGTELSGIRVRLELDPSARELARTGSRFWIVRPRLDLSGVSGLETVVGANYLMVLPGQGTFTDHFVGLEDPPLLEILEPGGLRITLTTPRKGSLRPGAPVNYRQVTVGTILEVGLAKDASAVEAEVYIHPQYASLIRSNTRFWKTGGARVSAGLTGLSLAVDSIQGLILGGVTLAIPPQPGQPVDDGHRFQVFDEPDDQWLEWVPRLSLYGEGDRQRPQPLRAELSWEYRNLLYLTRDSNRRGWLLPVAGGLLGPRDMLLPPEEAEPESVHLTLQGPPGTLPLTARPWGRADELALLPLDHGYESWEDFRSPQEPEAALVVAGPEQAIRYVAIEHYRPVDGDWLL
ncbi:MAG: MlaD family protein, partial [Candidatus Competibacteraceae bacterium]|nr:MlaD family protein [Candidatus Competibacteraceae bacterium]